MKPSYGTSLIIGAVTGLIVAIALFLFIASLGAVSALRPAIETDSATPVFSISASALWSMTLISGLVGGALLATITKGIARVIDPASSSVSLLVIAPLGAVVGAVIGMVVFPLGVTVLGTIAEGTATISVVGMTILTCISGLVGGATIVWLSYLLARPPVYEDDPALLHA